MRPEDTEWTDAEIARMHRLWIDGVPLNGMGEALGRSKNAVNGKINRLRKIEGEEKWPERGSPIKPPSGKPKWRRRQVRRGESTLPPLRSLG